MHELAIRPDDDGEPRLLDLDLAERLGYERPRKIRGLIDRHMDTIIEFGPCPTVGLGIGEGARAADAYLLNEEQAIYIATQSDAPNAKAVKILVVKVFSA